MCLFFSFIGIVLALALLGSLLRQQLVSLGQVTTPAPAAGAPTVRAQSQRIQQQYQQALDAALQAREPAASQ